MRTGATRALLLLGLALLPACTGEGVGERAPQGPLVIQVRGDGETQPCVAEIDGRRIDAERLAETARPWRERGARIAATMETPYRCVGGIIYALQRAGFTRIGFAAEPPPASEPDGPAEGE